MSAAPAARLERGRRAILPPSTPAYLALSAPGGTTAPFRVLGLLGCGGMGVVYKVEDPWLRHHLAVKVLRKELLGNARAEACFRREAALSGLIVNRRVVSVMGAGRLEDSRPYILMELVESSNLGDHIDLYGAVHPRQAARIALEISEALAVLHAENIVHRDVSSGNVFLLALEPTPRVKLGDFGTSAQQAELDLRARRGRASMVVGTPLYMSPEQACGLRCDARSDLYSLGVILFELLTGELPYDGNNAVAIAQQHVTAPVPRAYSPFGPLPRFLEQVLARLLGKRPEQRYSSAADLSRDLSRWLEREHSVIHRAIGRLSGRRG